MPITPLGRDPDGNDWLHRDPSNMERVPEQYQVWACNVNYEDIGLVDIATNVMAAMNPAVCAGQWETPHSLGTESATRALQLR